MASPSYRLYTSNLGGTREARDTSFAYFPFSDGWIGGYVDLDDTFFDGGNLPPGTTVDVGFSTGDIHELRIAIPGINSQTDGMLFVTTEVPSFNRAHVITTTPVADGSWSVAIRRSTASGEFDDEHFGFVYVPYATSSLVGGRIDDTGNVVDSRGTFSVTSVGTGRYQITVPGVTSAADGVLLLDIAQADAAGIASGSAISYQFDATAGAFEVQVRELSLATPRPLEDSGFAFAFIPFSPFQYQGTEEDLLTEHSVNNLPFTPFTVAELNPGDVINLRHSSPNGTLSNRGGPVAVFGSTAPTGTLLPSPLPNLHFDPSNTFFIFGGFIGGFPLSLPEAGINYGFTYPGGAAGLSLVVQCLLVDANASNGLFASTHGLEIRLL